MSHHARERLGRASWIFLLCLTLVSSSSNHRSVTPDVSTLKIEAEDSEASITLGKDLVLGPVSSEVTATSSNGSAYLLTASRDDPAIVISRVSANEVHRGALPRQAASKHAASRGSHVIAGSRYRTVKGSPKAADSYLEALRHSRISDDPREGIVRVDPKGTGTANRREYVHGPVYKPETTYGSKSPRIIAYGGGPGASSSSSPGDSFNLQSFKPSMGYDDRYGTPQNRYGPPQNPYGPMAQDDASSLYHQPSSAGNSYLPSQQGPAVQTSVPIYGALYALPDVSHVSILPSIDLGLPFALKLNAFTIAKIILKLVIFKMIVKFIAVICLLLFIPKLEIIKRKVSNKGEDDEEERSLSSPYTSSTALNDLESTVRSSIERYEVENDARSNTTERCTTPACRITEALTSSDESWPEYLGLFKSYVDEEESGRWSAKQ